MSRWKVSEYVKPLLAKFEEDKRSVIMRLNALGWTQEEISAKLQAMWPDAKGTSQPQLNKILSEMGKPTFPIKADLEKGHEPSELAKRTSQQSVTDILPEMGNLTFPAKADLEKGINQHDLPGKELPSRMTVTDFAALGIQE